MGDGRLSTSTDYPRNGGDIVVLNTMHACPRMHASMTVSYTHLTLPTKA